MSHPKPEGSFKGAPDPWGYYYLRYFVGAVIGAGLLLLLWKTRPSGMLPPLPDVLPSAAEGWLGFAAAVTALLSRIPQGIALAFAPLGTPPSYHKTSKLYD